VGVWGVVYGVWGALPLMGVFSFWYLVFGAHCPWFDE